MKHVLTASQFDRTTLETIMQQAADMEAILNSKTPCKMAEGKIMAALFYEPSTRTRLSFETAMLRLGGGVISETDVTFSSQTKGEILADTARMVGGYADIIAIRSKTPGDAKVVAEYSGVPVLNGGDGSAEHPTQGLLDLYTISKYFTLGKPLKVAFVGDLKYGRTVHSLCTLLRNFDNVEMTFVAPDSLQIPEKYVQEGDVKLDQLDTATLSNCDVIYDTRIQQERLEDPSIFKSVKDLFIFDPKKVNQMRDDAILMHPLPRINEITLEVDDLPQAKYFEQAKNGVPIRMALIARGLELI